MHCVHVQFPDVWSCYGSVWEIKTLFIRNLLVRQVFINHNRINWFLMSEEMKQSTPCTPWFATSPWNSSFSCMLTLLCLKCRMNKGIFFLLAGDRSCNHCPAALPAAPDARCGGQVFHGKCLGKFSSQVSVCLQCLTSGTSAAFLISPVQTSRKLWFFVSPAWTGVKSSFPFSWDN